MAFNKWITCSYAVLCFLVILVIYFLSYNNSGIWYINVASYFIPVLLVFVFLSCILFLVLKKYLLAASLFAGLVFLHKPVTETFSVGYLYAQNAEKDECPLNVMTYNVSTFNNHRTEPFMEDDSLFKSQFFNYLKKVPDDLDLICLQEFHHDDASNERIVDEIVKYTGTNYYYTVPIWENWNGGFFGIITLSKYPIINKGTLFVGSNILNRGIFTDIVYQKDTLRIINIHLHSLNIRLTNPDTSTGTLANIKYIFRSLKEGSLISKKQIDQVLMAIESSPYPVLLCGDFNTFPYGYAYQEVKKKLTNSFEKSGKGFGFTLNLFPYWIRLDNQFVSGKLIPVETKVIRSIRHSDHFPLISRYIIRPD